MKLLLPQGGSFTQYYQWITPQWINQFQTGQISFPTGFVIPGQVQQITFTPDNLRLLFGWLNPERLQFLQGGSFDPINLVWITSEGQPIKPGTPEWATYFGDLSVEQLKLLLPNGGAFTDFYDFITPQWIINFQNGQISLPAGFTPGKRRPLMYQGLDLNNFFGWLTPEKFQLLQGGRFDPVNLIWITSDDRQIQPGTPDWVLYFGDLSPDELKLLLPEGGSFTEFYDFINPQWIINFKHGQIQLPSGFVPGKRSQLMFAGNDLKLLFGWLTPERLQLLQGGQFDVANLVYITPGGQRIAPGTDDWVRFFGNLQPDQLRILLPNGGSFSE